MGDENVIETLSVEQDEFIKEHRYADTASEAHPIDEDILHTVCETKMGPLMISYDLALIQAVAVREIVSGDRDAETLIDHRGDNYYYEGRSASFYEILSIARHRYDTFYVKLDNLTDIAEAHTRQYLRDLHDYEGDFGGQVANDQIDKFHQATLCSAQNDEYRLRDEEPDVAHYAFTDARGLVIEEGTHPV